MYDSSGIAPPTIIAPPDIPDLPDRRPRGYLEFDVKRVTDIAVHNCEGVASDPLTPHRIGKQIISLEGLEAKPSTGAIADVLKRWVKIGYAICSEKPFAFLRYAETGSKEELAERHASWRAMRAALRSAKKATT